MKRRIVVAITGASGATYAVRLLEVLAAAGCEVHVSISTAGQTVLKHELGLTVDLAHFDPAALKLDAGPRFKDRKLEAVRTLAGAADEPGSLHYCYYRDPLSPIASGSFLTDGMVICPCSGRSLGSIAHGTSANLIHRAAEVHLKERRKLILVPRETPLSLVQLDNMKRAAKAGAVILPAMPGFYHGVKSIADLVDFVVARICDQLAIPHALVERWGSAEG
jgi:4-hydroxy-3-polyprenylbenzoate decarboxylase